MTQNRCDAQRLAELNAAFPALSDTEKDNVLAVLRALSFAQAVMGVDGCETAENADCQQTARAR